MCCGPRGLRVGHDLAAKQQHQQIGKPHRHRDTDTQTHSDTHTQTDTHTDTRTHTDTHMHTCTQTHTHTHTDRHTRRHTESHTCRHIYTHRHTCTQTHRETHMQTHIHTQTHMYTDTHTDTHTHTHRHTRMCTDWNGSGNPREGSGGPCLPWFLGGWRSLRSLPLSGLSSCGSKSPSLHGHLVPGGPHLDHICKDS